MSKFQPERAAIILAGGDGTRLSALTREMFGEAVPKQFCRFWNDRTLLEQTWSRASLAIDPARMITVLSARHSRFYEPLFAPAESDRMAVQPTNRGTAPAILYALMRLRKLAPGCSVAVFPSDHFVDDDRCFVHYVEAAFNAIEIAPEETILLGAKPRTADPQFGWIEPGEPLSNQSQLVRRVHGFLEKPPLCVARELKQCGWLWNTFVFVARLNKLLELYRVAMPTLFDSFIALEEVLGTHSEQAQLRRLYDCIDSVNFSSELLAKSSSALAVLPVSGVEWNDLGDPQRLAEVLECTQRAANEKGEHRFVETVGK